MARKAIAILVAILAEAFRQNPSAMTAKAYEVGLSDLSDGELEAATGRAMRQCKFFPTVAELRQLAGEMPPGDRAVIAWEAVLRAGRLHGYYHSVDFDDRAINATIRQMGGWEALSEQLERQDVTWVRKEFERVYQVYCRRGVTAAEGGPLGGYFSRMNAAAYPEHVPPPVSIRTTLTPVKALEDAALKSIEGHGEARRLKSEILKPTFY